MRANDQVTTDHIQNLETDNDHLRAELIVAYEEIARLKSIEAAYDLMVRDRECLVS